MDFLLNTQCDLRQHEGDDKSHLSSFLSFSIDNLNGASSHRHVLLSCVEIRVYIVVNYNLELCDTQVGEIECVGRQSEPKYMVQLA